jgi:hypothetical protein
MLPMTNTTTAKKTTNVALTIDGTTIVLPLSYLKFAQGAARKAADMGKAVTLKKTTEAITDVTAGLPTSGSCEDCELCGTFGGRHWWVVTEHGCGTWACRNCVTRTVVRKLVEAPAALSLAV